MSFFQSNFLMNIDRPQLKTKNKQKKLIPSKPSYLVPSSTLKSLKEKEAQFLKKESHNKFNNHPIYANKVLLTKRNAKDITLSNNNLSNSIKNVHILLRNNNSSNKSDYKNIINMNINLNNNILLANNSIKNIYNYYDNNEENKENIKNKYNTNSNSNANNYSLKNDKTIIVNKANKFTKEKNIKNNIYKKINLISKPKVKRRTLSSNINNIITNINIDNNNLKRNSIINENNNNNNSLLIDLIANHKRNNSIITNNNIIEKNITLKKTYNPEKLKSSRSFSKSVEKKINSNKNKKLSKNNSINKTLLNIDNSNNCKNNFNNTGNQFYTRLKQIVPYKNVSNYKTKLAESDSNNKSYELRNNSLNKSFTTNNFIKRFNLSQYEKQSHKDKKLNTIEQQDINEQKIRDYFSYIKTNNNFYNNNLITNNSSKFRKKYKTKSISDLSNLDIQILNKSRDSILNQKNVSVIEDEKETKKVHKKILKIDSCTIPGYTLTGVKQKNQDSFFLKKNFLSKDEHFFIGICDGHGLYGDLVSQYISETLPLYVKNTTKEELINAFIDTNNSLINKTKIDCSLSGTTCTSLIITLDKIICANIGDTRAILARFENGCYNTVNLSRDHKLTESEEIKRILSEGGVIKQLYNKKKKEYYGPERIWLKNSDIPGLSMSRSFGDNLAHTVGVNNIPDVKMFDYTGGEKFIVIASESVWQYIDSDECVRIIKDYYEKNMDAVGALNSLVTEAIKRWKKEENKIEDITAVVIFFE